MQCACYGFMPRDCGLPKQTFDNKSKYKSIACSCQHLAAAAFRKKGHNYVKKNMRITSPTGIGSPSDS